jgi:hypothetical protein
MKPKYTRSIMATTSLLAKQVYEDAQDLDELLGSTISNNSLVRQIGKGLAIIGGRASISEALGKRRNVPFVAATPCVVSAVRTEREVALGLANIARGATLVTGVGAEARRGFDESDFTNSFGHRPELSDKVGARVDAIRRGIPQGVALSGAAIMHGVAQIGAAKKYTIVQVLPTSGPPGSAPRIGPQFTAGDLADVFAQLVSNL